MTEDPTKDLTTDEMLRLILNRLTNVESRLGALESVAGDRVRETRPKLDLIIKALSDLREEMIDMKEQMGLLAKRELELGGVYSRLSSRVTALEDRARDGEHRN